MNPEPFDFRKPGRLPEFVESAIVAWHTRLVRALNDRWAKHFRFEFEMEQKGFDFCRGAELAARYEGEGIANQVPLSQDETRSMLMLPQRVGLNLVSALVGEDPAAEAEERELTSVEESLIQLLVRDVVAGLNESQPPLAGVAAQLTQTQVWKESIADIPHDCELIVAKFELKPPFQAGGFEWVVAASAMDSIVMRSSQANASEQGTSPDLERLVKQLPVEVVVRLGLRTLPMSALAELTPGDVLVLDQPITKPLTATIGGTTKYAGWPGRIGNRHAYQINSVEL